jgi:hypothetical protein
MGVSAEVGIDGGFFQSIGDLLHLRAIPAGKAADVRLESATYIFQIV